MKKTALNPYLPSWEYIPDGEPHIFDGRVYVYGSHDRFGGCMYCLNDYVCWSAPLDDLGDWRHEGLIYKTTDDPANRDARGCLYAPDVARGPDGRYYLYYVLSNHGFVSVAVCDSPAGKYEFHGYVHHADGTRLGEGAGDEPQFDPTVLVEDDKVYLYTGFCAIGDHSKSGAMATVLGPDMLSVVEAPVFVLPNEPNGAGTDFAGHEYFEAPSIRKKGDTYYLIYSSVLMYELCYATSTEPTRGFRYGGVIISNNDIGISTYKPADKAMYYGGNNHGGIVAIGGEWYIFYHRHTNGTNFSRQACAERIEILADGSIPQVEMTSCGLNGGPLPGRGRHFAYTACNLYCDTENKYTGGMGGNGLWMDAIYPKITQDGRDGDEEVGHILNMTDSATAGFKYFDCRGIKSIKICVRGYCKGVMEVRTSPDGPSLGEIPLTSANIWTAFGGDIAITDGICALYFTFRGRGNTAFLYFELS